MFASKAFWTGLCMTVFCAGVGVFLVSCDYFKSEEVSLLPIAIPGAEYVGMETCAGCHGQKVKEFRGATHAAFAVPEKEDQKVFSGEGCESCHGPGSLHVEGRGDKSKILKGDWTACVRCHMDKKAKFRMRFHHPVPEGRMSCSSCHDPHKGAAPVRRTEEINETCFKCHPSIRGPWTFTHDVVTEDGCPACHDPHGTSIRKMLRAPTNTLCLGCHVEAHNLTRGGCHNCHQGIHGSNFSEILRTE